MHRRRRSTLIFTFTRTVQIFAAFGVETLIFEMAPLIFKPNLDKGGSAKKILTLIFHFKVVHDAWTVIKSYQTTIRFVSQKMSERLSSQVILSISRRTEEANYCLWESQRSDQVIVMFCPHWAVWPQLHIAIGDKTDSDRHRRISKFGGKTDWDLFCGSPVIGAPVLLKRLTYNCQTTITVQQGWG